MIRQLFFQLLTRVVKILLKLIRLIREKKREMTASKKNEAGRIFVVTALGIIKDLFSVTSIKMGF